MKNQDLSTATEVSGGPEAKAWSWQSALRSALFAVLLLCGYSATYLSLTVIGHLPTSGPPHWFMYSRSPWLNQCGRLVFAPAYAIDRQLRDVEFAICVCPAIAPDDSADQAGR